MSYSNNGIAVLACIRIGVAPFVTGDGSRQDVSVSAIWDYIRDLVLEAKDWKFAKIRAVLSENATAPLNVWEHAYTIPSDFIRFAYGAPDDPPVCPEDSTEMSDAYVVEALPSTYEKVLMTNYDNSTYDLYINYIARVADPTKYSPSFIDALAWRLAAELANYIPESNKKFTDCMQLYEAALVRAASFNQSLDYQKDEKGNDDWEMAGRD